MKSQILISILLIANCLFATAEEKSDPIKPAWVHSIPHTKNNSYVFKIETAEGKTLDQARKECFNSLVQDAGFEKGVAVKIDYQNEEEEHSIVVDNHSRDVTETHFKVTSNVKGKETEIQGIKVDEYWERGEHGEYHLTTLYARSFVDKTPRFDEFSYTTKYGAKGLWRSAIVPGWGQLYKGSTLKGSLILGGTALLVGGAIYTDCMRADYASKINKTHSAENKRTYATRRDNFAMGRNICLGALGALYVYNLIDAIVAPGARRVLVHERPGGKSYSLVPAVTEDGGPAVAFAMTF